MADMVESSDIDVTVDRDGDIELVEADDLEVATDDEVADESVIEADTDLADADAEDNQAGETAVAQAAARVLIDPRGPRFGAAITVVVLAVALLTIPSVVAVVALVAQAIVFGAAALFGLKAQPYGMIYRSYVAPRLRPPDGLEDEAPPRFAQQVGLVFVLVAIIALALSAVPVAQIATALALAAAFLNAAFNFCLGCEIYLLVQRLRSHKAPAA
jgi:hypothetical protein